MYLLWWSGETFEVLRAEGGVGTSALTVLGSFTDEATALAPLSFCLLLYFIPEAGVVWGECRAFHPYRGLKSIEKGVTVILKTSLNFLHCLIDSLLC